MTTTSSARRFIAGDWGSSFMRLYLCRQDASGVVVEDMVRGEGIKTCGEPEAAFFAAAGPWFDKHGPLPTVLSGMIGSTLGWRDSGYAACPASPESIKDGLAPFEARGVSITIAPGLRCRNLFGLPDVMRGEEMQIFGWLDQQARGADEAHLVCLPGTHAKWATTQGRAVVSFFTSMQGELHDLLLGNSLLGRTAGEFAKNPRIDEAAFRDGVTTMLADPTLSMQHGIFSMRSRVVMGELPADKSPSYLSGLLIGAEVRDGVAAHRARDLYVETVVLIGAERLVALYGIALEMMGLKSTPVVDHDASVRGLAALA